jgi:diguanylate cyclase (GGDEF)-like protein
MAPPNAPKTTNILIATAEAGLTRQLSQFLRAAGYPTCEAGHAQTAATALQSSEPRIVILDTLLAADNDWALCRTLAERPAADRPFLILLTPSTEAAHVRAALEAGIDDVLSLPVCFGELLSRLRVATRVLEHDRRASRQEPFEPVTGLWSQSAFVGQLRQHWAATSDTHRGLACVVIDLDFTRAIRQSEGVGGVNTLVAGVATELNRLRDKDGVLACLGGDRFGVMRPGETAEQAAQWAESVRHGLTQKTFVSGGQTEYKLTASLGVAGCETAESPEQLLEQANAALAAAKASGRNCLMRWGEFTTDAESTSSMQSRILERTMARHVMIPCSVFLQADDSSTCAARLLHQARLDALPVVDTSGQLVGLCKQELLDNSPRRGPDQRVSAVMISKVHRFRPNEDVAALIDYFNQDPLAWAVVVDEGRPVGLLNCDSLVALSQSAGTKSFAGEEPYDESTAYLLVPDIAPEELGQEA